jgi:hypothetical protein
VPHGFSAIELQHERDVLKQQPARPLLPLDQPEDFPHEPGVGASDPLRSARLRQVLTREAGCHEIQVVGQSSKLADILVQLDFRHVVSEDCSRCGINLAEHRGLPAGLAQAYFQTADAGK